MIEWATNSYAEILESVQYSREDRDTDWDDHASLCIVLFSYEDIIGRIERYYERLQNEKY